MADITTDDQIAEVIAKAVNSAQNIGAGLEEYARAIARTLREEGVLITGLIDELRDLKALAEQAFGGECEARVTISTAPGYATVEYRANGKLAFIFGHGKTARECIEDARRQIQETVDQRAREHADLCATLGITPDGRIIEQAA